MLKSCGWWGGVVVVVVAHVIIESAPVQRIGFLDFSDLGICWDRGLGLGLDNIARSERF